MPRVGWRRKVSSVQGTANEYSRSQIVDASADEVFRFVSEIGNLPKYLPPIQHVELLGGDQIRLRGETPSRGEIDGQGYFRAYPEERRMEWGANVGRDYSGSFRVMEQGQSRSEIGVSPTFGPLYLPRARAGADERFRRGDRRRGAVRVERPGTTGRPQGVPPTKGGGVARVAGANNPG